MSAPDRPDVPAVDDMSDAQVARLLAAILPTRPERALTVVAKGLWRTARAVEAAGDVVDELRCVLQRERAAAGRHLDGRRR